MKKKKNNSLTFRFRISSVFFANIFELPEDPVFGSWYYRRFFKGLKMNYKFLKPENDSFGPIKIRKKTFSSISWGLLLKLHNNIVKNRCFSSICERTIYIGIKICLEFFKAFFKKAEIMPCPWDIGRGISVIQKIIF